ncbi:hypothetical protein JCM10213v2_004949 [Rhodosporidiobolus nylandii]
MADDVASLHGVASDSGYASSASRPLRRGQKRARSALRSNAPDSGPFNGSLNARFDRLNREMEEVAEAPKASGAGRSLGIRRKRIVPKPAARVEMGGIEGKAARASEVEMEETPQPKRRRSLGPTMPPSKRTAPVEGGAQASDEEDEPEEPPIWLKRVVSPHSGKQRTVALEPADEQLQETPSYLGEPMKVPSFMRDKAAASPDRQLFSPQPAWISRYLASTPAPSPPPPHPSHPQVAPPYLPHAPSPSSSLPFAPSDEQYFEPPPSPTAGLPASSVYPPSHPTARLPASTPLPFSTTGPRPPSLSRMSARHADKAPLYESQLERVSGAFHLVTPPVFEDAVPSPSPSFHAQPFAPLSAYQQEPYQPLYGPHSPVPFPQPAFPPSQPYYAHPPVDEETQRQPLEQPPHNLLGPSTFAPNSNPSASSHGVFPRLASPAYHDERQAPPHACPQLQVDVQGQMMLLAPASNFWKHCPLPQLRLPQAQVSLRPDQLRFFGSQLEPIQHPDAGNLDRLERKRGLSPRPRPRDSRPSTSTFRILKTPPPQPPPHHVGDHPPSLPTSRQHSAQTPLQPLAARSSSLRRLQDENGAPRAVTHSARHPPKSGVLVPDSPPLPPSRVAALADAGSKEGTPSPSASPDKPTEAVKGEAETVDPGKPAADRGKDGRGGAKPEEGTQVAKIRFDWDVSSEGERLIAAALASEASGDAGEEQGKATEAEGRAPEQQDGGFAFYEDPADPVEE